LREEGGREKIGVVVLEGERGERWEEGVAEVMNELGF